ncbi:hypothetical protein TraAM80_07956 [Trypanosoma rangeli]|uniref:EF-hand domain-containing protein n=1 Tax=Trypanosoma rangeli TaxID=5698 RepID=A0A422N319_TRYRA|nr:uncharacterized protein TraAM80_07956 [Trypanosoma rangeli]RNE99831.1 hypothetical protein TraAM80_07956 [Trypanosoma rangeli]|eukprot:RNE99831.1 hypothetical protein TraAM80_07956 [Trypanosoma rangeli]
MTNKTARKTQGAMPAEESAKKVVSKTIPALRQLSKGMSVSGMIGVAVGVAAKRLTQDALYGAGLAVVALQSLSYLGYIQINWKKVESDLNQVIDANADGKVDGKDLKVYFDRFIKFASKGLGDAGAFAAGFITGARYLA